MKKRLDLLLLEKKLVESREKARALILSGQVIVDGQVITKCGSLVKADCGLELKEGPRYVSRGGIKLEAALRHFQLDVRDKVVLDVGASTGGFTDCLLQFGARLVIAVDVGYGQIHPKLRQDNRVFLLERKNIRYLRAHELPCVPEGATIDVSFISLRLVAEPISLLLAQEAFLVALIKPQFEVGKGKVGKGGVVKDPLLHQEVKDRVCETFESLGWEKIGLIPSPIKGPKGNVEFLLGLKRPGGLSL